MSEQVPADEQVNPVLYTFSRPQLEGRALEFMRIQFGSPRELDPEQRERWYERLGVLNVFIHNITEDWNGL